MVTSSDLKFWCALDVPEEDAARYTAAVAPEFAADGGNLLAGEMQTEALCYLIAAKIAIKDSRYGLQSESLGGYSYTRKSSDSSSHWLDIYHELISSLSQVNSGDGVVVRKDTDLIRLNRRYGHDRRF
ncbi:MAG TPA: hypothetical protein O0X25_04075 [Methanocorpusculum sp.]|nr:hypothetical protein [Methanocorpusculum sp.]HJJ49776.1 hypothetical protein [Methanocorpusculum sp.]HJJ57386.1 hypothetical protein [Methanocorpusculum sp.]